MSELKKTDASLEATLKQPPKLHMKSYIALMWFLVLVILMVGVVLTRQQFLGYEWFSRSGSVVVILGVLSGFGGIIQERILHSQLAFQHRLMLLKTRKKLRSIKATAEYMDEEIEDLNQQFIKRTESLEQSLKVKAGVLELSILLLGTLIWGFGDILVTFLF